MMSYDYPHPVSRTYQYKKITKPLLERKRRARINRCLDELKDLMVDALETEGENISKLEKADILELTVRHLQRLHASRPSGLSPSALPNEDATTSESRWQSGFGHCAAEACRYLAGLPGESGERLARHLASGLQTTRRSTGDSTSPKILVAPSPIVCADRTSNFSGPISPNLPMELSVMMDSRETDSPIDSSRYSVMSETSDNQDVTDFTPALISVRIFDSPDRQIPIESKARLAIPKNDNETIPAAVRIKENKFTKIEGRSAGPDDDEEIDVEGVDESDPMWRPW